MDYSKGFIQFSVLLVNNIRRQKCFGHISEDLLIELSTELYFYVNAMQISKVQVHKIKSFCDEILKQLVQKLEQYTTNGNSSSDAKTIIDELHLNDFIKNQLKVNPKKMNWRLKDTDVRNSKEIIRSWLLLFYNDNFVGRSSYLREIDRELVNENRVAITGIPGIGKKELAKAYVRKFQKLYFKIIWSDSEGNEHILLEEDNINYVQHREYTLKKHIPRLMSVDLYIYENEKNIRDHANSKVILLSQQKVLNMKNLKLDGFNDFESIDFFRSNGKLSRDLTPIIARRISTKLQNYPLALREIIKLSNKELVTLDKNDDNLWLHAQVAYNTLCNFAEPLLKNRLKLIYFDPQHIHNFKYAVELETNLIIFKEKKKAKLNETIQKVMRIKFADMEEHYLKSCLLQCKQFTKSKNNAYEHVAYIWKDVCKYEKLIRKHFDCKYEFHIPNTSTLHILSGYGMTKEIKLIFKYFDKEQRRKFINAKDGKGNSSLHFAARTCNILLEYFLENGGEIHSVGQFRKSLLHYAVEGRMLNSIHVLLQYKINLEMKDKDDRTALQYAIKRNNHQIVEKLLSLGAKHNVVNKEGMNLLHIAAESSNIMSINTLATNIHIQDYINAKDRNGLTPLHYGVKNGHVNCVKYLINLNADVNIKDRQNLSLEKYTEPSFRATKAEFLKSKGVFCFDSARLQRSITIDKYMKEDYEKVLNVLKVVREKSKSTEEASCSNLYEN